MAICPALTLPKIGQEVLLFYFLGQSEMAMAKTLLTAVSENEKAF